MRYFLSLLIVGFASCNMSYEYEEPLPPIDFIEVPEWDTEEFVRGRWLLVGGQFYVNNHVSDNTTTTDHFGEGNKSSLNIEGTAYDFEALIRNKTTWTFYPENREIDQFWLNQDSIHPLWLTSFADTVFNVNEYPVPIDFQQLGGSTRPIILVSHGYDTMTIIVQEAEVNYQGWNVKYWSELTFRKVASW